MTTQRQTKIILLLGFISVGGLFIFQNCSSSLSILTRGYPTKAQEDFSEMLNQSENEIRNTKNVMSEQDMFVDDKSRFRKTASELSAQESSIEDPKSKMKLKLKPKRTKKVRK